MPSRAEGGDERGIATAACASKASSSGTAAPPCCTASTSRSSRASSSCCSGPSGSGKTTTLRILAGLETVSGGRVLMDGEDVTHREPGERDVAMVFQSYALYPHMTVAQNIGFPLKMVGTPAGEIDAAGRRGRRPRSTSATCSSAGPASCRAASSSAARWRAPSCASRGCSCSTSRCRTSTPSCGWRRALELHALQRALGITTVYVTHDQEEAMTLADRIAVFMDGRIVQVGTPREIFARPRTMAVAGFIGTPPMNLLPGTWRRQRRHRRPAHDAAAWRKSLPIARDVVARRAARATCASPPTACRRASSASRTSATAPSSASTSPSGRLREAARATGCRRRRRRAACCVALRARGRAPVRPAERRQRL